MRKNIFSNSLVVGIIVLFIGASVVSAFSINLFNEFIPMSRGWLYVGGSGPGNYTKIQDAIDNASDGDTIFVYNGTYLETYYGCDMYINKPINVVGENKETTIIFGGNSYPYNSIAIENNEGVEFSGFTINNSFLGFNQCDNSIIHDVIVNRDATYDSMCVWINGYSDNNIFYDNIFNNSEQPVRIWSDGSTNNLFYHNNFCNNTNPPYDYSSGNYFYNATLGEGNYYDDYTGIDDVDYPGHYHCDGIGDTPYNILGGSNQDLYPLMYPWYPEHPDNIYVDKEYNISTPGFGYDKFNKVQYGINEISENGTVYVFNGNYTEDLDMHYKINKTNVTLIGESMDNVILNRKNWIAFNLYNCIDVTIKNFNLSGMYFGINDHNTRVKVSNLYVNPSGAILGIEIFHSNQDCEIYNCYVTNSEYGIWVPWAQGNPDSTNTHIYHNNIFDNTNCARDDGDGSSIWEYNYYDDYTGEDNDGDGIGDTPYNIGGSAGNQDLYPFMEPNGWLKNPPNKPSKPSGQIHGKAGVLYTYTTNTTDPDGDQVYYKWDWGDGSYSDWLGPYDSGLEVSASQAWAKGSYNIKVKAKDTQGAESDWSGPLNIKMPRSKAINRPLLKIFENYHNLLLLLQRLFQRLGLY
jgi:nitrous oxidase accessory protein NosD